MLSLVLKGIQRSTPQHTRATRLPITPEILHKIYALWSNHPLTFDRVMLWAAFCVGYFAFMRSGEFTSTSNVEDNGGLLVSDVTVDSRHNPQVVTLLLRRSKTDPFGAGTQLHVGRTFNAICPVSALLSYLALRPQTPGPLFIFQDGTPLSRPSLVSHLRDALQSIGLDAAKFSGHSFRIGAASAAARAGFSDSFIKTLGRRKSAAFTRYIRTPIQDITAATAVLATSHSES